MTSPSIHHPADLQELTQLVQAAAASRTALQIIGGGSKRDVGLPDRATTLVSMTRFDRIVDYDPAELVITVGAGVRLAAMQALLSAHRQMLAFEPFDFAVISQTLPGEATIGGVVAAGIAGSRRLSAGNVRDHVLGFTAVSGRGERFVAGGRVVKNVTGYDLSKLMCGSWGQLAALTELTLKVLPQPRTSLSLRLRDLELAHAFAAMTRAARSQCEVAAAAYFPHGSIDEHSHTLLRLQGFGPSVEARARHLVQLLSDLAPAKAIEHIEAEQSTALWSRIPAAVVPSDPNANEALWRICVPSTSGVRLCGWLRELQARYCVDWGGALIWARLAADSSAAQVRGLAEDCGGHATLLRAPHDYRRRVPALHPEPPPVAALSRRVRVAFDPAGILDPLRFA